MQALKSIYKVFLFLSVILFLAPNTAYCRGIAKSSPIKAPDFALKELNGNTLRLSDLKGRVVFLNFFAHWCPPCRQEMPSMQKLYDKLKGPAFEMLAVAVSSSGKNDVEKLVLSNGYTFKVLLDTSGKASDNYGIYSIPATFIIDKKGTIVRKEIGSRDWSDETTVLFLKKLVK